MIKLRRAAVAPVAIVLTALLVPAAAAGAATALPGAAGRDTVSVVGWNFEANRAASVLAGDATSALRITYAAGRPLRDGTVRIALPRQQWPTALTPAAGFYDSYPNQTTDNGKVSVLPHENIATPLGSCTGGGTAGVVPDADVSVQTAAGLQLITVRHVSCAADHQLVVRIKGVQAPARTGQYLIPVVASAAGTLPRVSVGSVVVTPVPAVQLVVVMAGDQEFRPGQQFSFSILAMNADGQPVQHYTGAVAVESDPFDCTLTPRDGSIAAEFTAGNPVQAVSVAVFQTLAQRIRVYDVTKHALPTVTPDFTILDVPVDPGGLICPVSFH